MLQQIAPAMPQASDEQVSNLRTTLEKLSVVLAEENQVLEQGAVGDHSAFIAAKNQILKELMVMHKLVPLSALPPLVVGELQATRSLVDRNQKLLGLQVKALNEVTAFMTKTAIAEAGDGTYARDQP
jgi:hypothetical protein